MKRWIVMGTFILLFVVACNSAMRGGEKSTALTSDMPNTLKLADGQLVYDLSGNWSAATKSSCGNSFNGPIAITQKGNLILGSLQSGNYPVETNEMIRGTLKGAELSEIIFNTGCGLIASDAEILKSGTVIDISTEFQYLGSNIRWDSTLTKQK